MYKNIISIEQDKLLQFITHYSLLITHYSLLIIIFVDLSYDKENRHRSRNKK